MNIYDTLTNDHNLFMNVHKVSLQSTPYPLVLELELCNFLDK